MAEGEGRSPWFYVSIGCGGILLIFALAVGVLLVVGFRAARSFKEGLTDPAVRAEKARRVLGADALPEGYFAGPVLSVPLLFELAVLTDHAPEGDGSFDPETERMFIYMKVISGGRNWRDYVEGQADPFEMLDDRGFSLQRGERVATEELAVADQRILYVTERGTFSSNQHTTEEGLLTLMFIRCPDDRKMRIGVWIAEDPEPSRPVAELDLSGTVADPDAVREFVSGFRTCG